MTATVPESIALVTIPDVELIKIGTWKLSTGEATFSTEDLASAVAALDCPAVRNPPLKLGHSEPDPSGGMRWDGEPSIGYVANMRLTDDGATVSGDYAGVPSWLADVMASAYPDRSVEAVRNFVCQVGHVHQMVVTAVALLGVEAPGVGTLKSLQSVADLYQAAVDGPEPENKIIVVFPEGRMTDPIKAQVSTDDVRRAYYESGTPMNMWVCEIQMDPMQLITMDDASGKMYRVPVKIKNDAISFSDPVEVKMTYLDASAGEAAEGRVMLARAAEQDLRKSVLRSLAGAMKVHHTGTTSTTFDRNAMWKNCGTDAAELKAATAWMDSEGDPTTKAAYKFIHHQVASDGTVGDANLTACSGGIGVLNGGRGVDVAAQPWADDRAAIYKHLAAHLEDAGQTPPELAASGPAHASAHDHGKDHDVEFTDDQVTALRTALGLKDDEELTPEALAAGVASLATSDAAKLAAAGPGTVVLDADTYADLQKQINEGREARKVQLQSARDQALDAAIQAGKFAPARREIWARIWDKDPKGTADVLATMTPGAVPVDDLGYPGDPEAYRQTEFDTLWPEGHQMRSDYAPQRG
jgi:hypothetical protein